MPRLNPFLTAPYYRSLDCDRISLQFPARCFQLDSTQDYGRKSSRHHIGWNFQRAFTLSRRTIGDEQDKFIWILIAQLDQKQIHTIGTHRGKNQKITGPINGTDGSISISLLSDDLRVYSGSNSQGGPTPVGIGDSAKAGSSSSITCQGRPLFCC